MIWDSLKCTGKDASHLRTKLAEAEVQSIHVEGRLQKETGLIAIPEL